MSEEQRIAEEVDEHVAERSRELIEANEALKKELVVERQRTEAARRANDHDARLILASIPGLVASHGAPRGGLADRYHARSLRTPTEVRRATCRPSARSRAPTGLTPTHRRS